MKFLVSRDESDKPAIEFDSTADLLSWLDMCINRVGFLHDGEALLIRRADYLDTKTPEAVESGKVYGHLRVV